MRWPTQTLYMKSLWQWIVRFSDMPATLGGQITLLVGIFTLVAMSWAGHKAYIKHIRDEQQHQEWLEILILWYARQTGYTVPSEIIERHRRINGNNNLPKSIKDEIYGPDRPPSDAHHKSARAMGLVDDDK